LIETGDFQFLIIWLALFAIYWSLEKRPYLASATMAVSAAMVLLGILLRLLPYLQGHDFVQPNLR
jgi:hypothetical protein